MDDFISRNKALQFKLTANLRPKELTVAQAVADAIAEYIKAIPASDVEPVRHAHWVKRMEERKGNGYEAFTPVWSCSDCGKDYDPATCSIIKYCFECGAKMDGGKR